MKFPFLLVLAWAASPAAAAEPPAPVEARVAALLPQVDALLAEYGRTRPVPGQVHGVVLDGRLVHVRATGFADVEGGVPVRRETRFRIASMTKSFVALTILRLRDEGKLSLDDPLTRYHPAFPAGGAVPRDAAPVTLRRLLTMTAGLPEDNPWGDRQMALGGADIEALLRAGLSFSTPPGQEFEYSNLGYILLGGVITRVTGRPFQAEITERILRPLGMDATVWDHRDVPAGLLALPYRWEHDAWRREPLADDGAGAALGGLITTIDDFARYQAFHLAAWPARDEPEPVVAHRATVRELHQPHAFSSLTEAVPADGLPAAVQFYGFGLTWRRDARGVTFVGHNGGLPGYGSTHRFCPGRGVGIIAFANGTYASGSLPALRALTLLVEQGALREAAEPGSAVLATRAREVAELIQTWDPALEDRILAVNFFQDRSRPDWQRASARALAAIGPVRSTGAVVPENRLRGHFLLEGERGALDVFFTLTPEAVPRVQELRLSPLPSGR